MTDFSLRKTAKPVVYPAETRSLNFFDVDLNLQRVLERLAPDMLERNLERLRDFGVWAGGELDAQASYSDRYAPPRLETHNKQGEKKSRVIFNPRYEACHRDAYKRGVIGLAFKDEQPEPHLLTFTTGYLMSQADISVHCPVTMTGAVAYVLARYARAAVRDEYLSQLTRMDGEAQTAGTWCTELHGGSDIGATTTRAVSGHGKVRLYGLKWFTSNATSGLALATARPEGAPPGSKGLGLYLVPSHLQGGEANGYSIRRLKDKLGTRGLATGEIDLEGAEAIEIAAPPHGLKIMMEALEYSRVHNAVAAAGSTRRAFLEAACWATHRRAFGREIVHYPMVQNQLMNLMMRAEASTALAFEAASNFDGALQDQGKGPWLRLVTALAKYRTAEAAVQSSKEAIEIVGGNGYTEEFPTARLFRDAMVLPVWEGPANIQSLELLRMVAGKEPGDQIFIDRVRHVASGLPPEMAAERTLIEKGLAEASNALTYLRANPRDGERFASRLMDHMADVLSGALLADEAARDLGLNDARKALVVRRVLEKAFGPREFKVDAEPDPVHQNFDALLAYSPIEPETLGYTAKARGQSHV